MFNVFAAAIKFARQKNNKCLRLTTVKTPYFENNGGNYVNFLYLRNFLNTIDVFTDSMNPIFNCLFVLG